MFLFHYLLLSLFFLHLVPFSTYTFTNQTIMDEHRHNIVIFVFSMEIQHVIFVVTTLQKLALHQCWWWLPSLWKQIEHQENNLYGHMSKQMVSWRINFWTTIQEKSLIKRTRLILFVWYCNSIIKSSKFTYKNIHSNWNTKAIAFSWLSNGNTLQIVWWNL